MATIRKTEIILPNRQKFIKVTKYIDGAQKRRRVPYISEAKPLPTASLEGAYFSIELPNEVKIFIGKENVVAKTADAVDIEFKEALQKWAQAAKEIKEVLIVKIETSKDETDRNHQSEYSLKVEYSWGKYKKTKIGNNCDYEYLKVGMPVINSWQINNLRTEGSISSYWDEKIKIIDWTKERQKWLEDLEASFTSMIAKAHNFMVHNNSEQIAKLIDKGGNLLPASTTPTVIKKGKAKT